MTIATLLLALVCAASSAAAEGQARWVSSSLGATGIREGGLDDPMFGSPPHLASARWGPDVGGALSIDLESARSLGLGLQLGGWRWRGVAASGQLRSTLVGSLSLVTRVTAVRHVTPEVGSSLRIEVSMGPSAALVAITEPRRRGIATTGPGRSYYGVHFGVRVALDIRVGRHATIGVAAGYVHHILTTTSSGPEGTCEERAGLRVAACAEHAMGVRDATLEAVLRIEL